MRTYTQIYVPCAARATRNCITIMIESGHYSMTDFKSDELERIYKYMPKKHNDT